MGGITVEDITAKEISTEVSGLGSVNLSGEVDKQTVTRNGLGNYNAEDLESRECIVKVDARGVITGAPSCVVTVNVSDILNVTLKTDANDHINVCYKGNPDVTENVSGGGSVRKIQ